MFLNLSKKFGENSSSATNYISAWMSERPNLVGNPLGFHVCLVVYPQYPDPSRAPLRENQDLVKFSKDHNSHDFSNPCGMNK